MSLSVQDSDRFRKRLCSTAALGLLIVAAATTANAEDPDPLPKPSWLRQLEMPLLGSRYERDRKQLPMTGKQRTYLTQLIDRAISPVLKPAERAYRRQLAISRQLEQRESVAFGLLGEQSWAAERKAWGELRDDKNALFRKWPSRHVRQVIGDVRRQILQDQLTRADVVQLRAAMLYLHQLHSECIQRDGRYEHLLQTLPDHVLITKTAEDDFSGHSFPTSCYSDFKRLYNLNLSPQDFAEREAEVHRAWGHLDSKNYRSFRYRRRFTLAGKPRLPSTLYDEPVVPSDVSRIELSVEEEFRLSMIYFNSVDLRDAKQHARERIARERIEQTVKNFQPTAEPFGLPRDLLAGYRWLAAALPDPAFPDALPATVERYPIPERDLNSKIGPAGQQPERATSAAEPTFAPPEASIFPTESLGEPAPSSTPSGFGKSPASETPSPSASAPFVPNSVWTGHCDEGVATGRLRLEVEKTQHGRFSGILCVDSIAIGSRPSRPYGIRCRVAGRVDGDKATLAVTETFVDDQQADPLAGIEIQGRIKSYAFQGTWQVPGTSRRGEIALTHRW